MKLHRAPKEKAFSTASDNPSVAGHPSGHSVDGPYRDLREALEARRRALRRQRDEALNAAAEAQRALTSLEELDAVHPHRARQRLVHGIWLVAIAGLTAWLAYFLLLQQPFAVRRAPAPAMPAAATAAPAGPRVLDPRKTEHLLGNPSPSIAEHIRKLGPQLWEVDESVVHDTLEEPFRDRWVRVIPHEVEGRTVGVKVFGIRPGSMLDALGFQNGDLVRSVDGLDIATPDAALEAYGRLGGRDEHVVRITREGRVRQHHYHVRLGR